MNALNHDPTTSETSEKLCRVGIAKRAITPTEPGQFLAGFDINRRATGVHDDIWVRAIVIDDGRTVIAIASFDLIGLLHHEVEIIRQAVPQLDPQNIILAATHVHSAPDTIGLWGPTPSESGVDPAYLEILYRRGGECLKDALASMRQARIRFATTLQPPETAFNTRNAKLIDQEIGILHAVDEHGEAIGTLLNWACHPTALWHDNTLITSDFVGYLRDMVELETGGMTLFANGALGGVAAVHESGPKTFEEAARIGAAVGRRVLKALHDAPRKYTQPNIRVVSSPISFPSDNEKFKHAVMSGIIPVPEALRADFLRFANTEVTLIDFGEAQIATAPGEILPAVGLAMKEMLPGPHRFLFGPAQDELGYILPENYFQEDLYAYECSMSVGPKTAPLLLAKLQELCHQLGFKPETAGK